MPFVSEQQRKWMWVNKPEMAKKWEDHTPDKKKVPKLPKNIKKKEENKADAYAHLRKLVS